MNDPFNKEAEKEYQDDTTSRYSGAGLLGAFIFATVVGLIAMKDHIVPPERFKEDPAKLVNSFEPAANPVIDNTYQNTKENRQMAEDAMKQIRKEYSYALSKDDVLYPIKIEELNLARNKAKPSTQTIVIIGTASKKTLKKQKLDVQDIYFKKDTRYDNGVDYQVVHAGDTLFAFCGNAHKYVAESEETEQKQYKSKTLLAINNKK